MVVITGYSEKLDGFLFVHNGTIDESINALIEKIDRSMVLVNQDNRQFLVNKDQDFDPDCIRYEGWEIFVSEIESGFADNCVCW